MEMIVLYRKPGELVEHVDLLVDAWYEFEELQSVPPLLYIAEEIQRIEAQERIELYTMVGGKPVGALILAYATSPVRGHMLYNMHMYVLPEYRGSPALNRLLTWTKQYSRSTDRTLAISKRIDKNTQRIKYWS